MAKCWLSSRKRSDLRSGVDALRAWAWDRDRGACQRRAAAGAFTIRLASVVLAFLSQALVARWIGGDAFGVYAYVWTWALLLGGAADFGLGTAAQRLIPGYAGAGAALLRGFLLASRVLAVVLSSAVALLALAVVSLLEPVLDTAIAIPLCLAIITVPLHGLALVQDGIARSYEWFDLALLPLYVVRPLGMLLLMAGAHGLGYPPTAISALVAAVAATCIALIVQLVILDRRLRAAVPPGPKAYAPGPWLTTSLPLFLAATSYLLVPYVDVLVLRHFSPPHEVGVYFAAVKTLALVAFIYLSASALVGRNLPRFDDAPHPERLARFLGDAVSWAFWPSLMMICAVLFFGRPILGLFGPDYVEAYPFLSVLSLGFLARATVGPAERILSAAGQHKTCAIVYAFAFAFNLLACLLLVPRWGGAGAAVSTACALTLESGVLFLAAKRWLGLPFLPGPAATAWRRAGDTLRRGAQAQTT